MLPSWAILLVLLLLLQHRLANAAEFDCDCHDGDVTITAPFQILQSPPDTCLQHCTWRVSADSDVQRVQLTVQEADPAITITVLDGADDSASPVISNCDTSVQESVCYSKGRYMIIKSATNPGQTTNGNNFALRFSSVAQSSIGIGNNGSTASHDHTGLIVGLVVAFVILFILIMIVIFLVYVHFKKRRESQNASSIQRNSDSENSHPMVVKMQSEIAVIYAPPTPIIAPIAPPRTSLVPLSHSFEYEGSIEPSYPAPHEYFMKK